MTASELRQVRSVPLFSGLDDTQLKCIDPGEVIHVPLGTVLAAEGEEPLNRSFVTEQANLLDGTIQECPLVVRTVAAKVREMEFWAL